MCGLELEGAIPFWALLLLCLGCILVGWMLAAAAPVGREWPLLRSVRAYLELNFFYRNDSMWLQNILETVNPAVSLVQSPQQVALTSAAMLAVLKSVGGILTRA